MPVPVPGPAVVTSTPAEAGAEAAKGRALDAALAAVEATPLEGRAEPSVKPAAAGTEKEPGPVVAASGGLYLQVGAFGDPSNAERLRQRLVANLSEQVRVQRSATSEPALFKVRIGPLGSEGEARMVSAKLVTLGVDQPRRVWN
jgi:rare lipoprotein A